jgi:hypothetical protein
MTRRLFMGALTAGLVLALVGCGVPGCSSKKSSSVTTTVVTTTVATSPTTTSPPPPPTTTVAAAAPCGAGAFLPVLKEAFDGNAPKLTVVRADVERCRNDYAQVFAVPDPSVCKPGVEFCYETEQVFLHWDGDAWTIETSGTGIACGSETMASEPPVVVKVCRALGYPDLTEPFFKMPSKNIGCAFFSGTLRCDVLSGMVPEPTGSCPNDWVGLVITTGGAAEPQCAGDTVYDKNAPTLTYGGTWKRGGITCTSSEAGLACSNGAGHAFKLAREGWSAS